LDEEEAMVYFRQILAAVGYCHSFNICHRDLKPENVLVAKDKTIKIADFGMAALHQTPSHKLKTSCGSPHYAAPEVVGGALYKGNKTDIWSLGVILFATLVGRLPFDTDPGDRDWIGGLLEKIQRGVFTMPQHLSPSAQDLIYRMLQVNPARRISMKEIWEHSLIRNYDYVDSFGAGYMPMSPSAKYCGRPVQRRSEISKEILRHLRSLWHRMTEEQLMDALLCEE
jgi:serine/threonine-protein kinase HSL1 (negative regulator of Swe1 kinase)